MAGLNRRRFAANLVAHQTLKILRPSARDAVGRQQFETIEKDLKMKYALNWVSRFAILSATFATMAADRNAPAVPDDKSQRRFQVTRTERLTAPVKATEITGKQVTNSKNEKLGRVEELGVDVESGRVTMVIINSGGVLGVGGRSIAVPPRAFSYDASGKALRLDVDPEKLKSAPEFKMSNWKDAAQTNRVLEMDRYYGQEPGLAGAREATNPPLDRIEKAGRVIGFPVVNRENKKLGQVDNLIIDLPNGRIVHVVVSSGGLLGVGDSLNAVPPHAFRYTSDGDALQINLTKEELTRAPGFKKTEWPDFSDPTYSEKIYRAHGVEPYFGTDADNTARNVRDRGDAALTLLDQGRSEGDMLITRRIRQEILARDGLSANARNVKVITSSGRVTLRGPVNDPGEKEAINAIATRLAANGNVDNQLEVKREP